MTDGMIFMWLIISFCIGFFVGTRVIIRKEKKIDKKEDEK